MFTQAFAASLCIFSARSRVLEEIIPASTKKYGRGQKEAR
jgi:hypothetical protein